MSGQEGERVRKRSMSVMANIATKCSETSGIKWSSDGAADLESAVCLAVSEFSDSRVVDKDG